MTAHVGACLAVCLALSHAGRGCRAGPLSLDNSGKEILLRTNVTALRDPAEWIEVSWQGVKHPSRYDAVALLVPADADVTKTAPVKFQWAERARSHLKDGRGSLSFRALNHRAAFRFILVTDVRNWANGSFTILASSTPVLIERPNQPLQGHLLLTANPRSLVLQWSTRDASPQGARWGLQPGQYTDKANNENVTTTTYTAASMCGGVANSSGYIPPGIFHRALLAGLEPDTTYFYTFGSDVDGWAEEAHFRTMPAPGSGAEVRVLALADQGWGEYDGSLNFPGAKPDPISLQPPGTPKEIKAEVRNAFSARWNVYNAALRTAVAMREDIHGSHLVVHNGDISYAKGLVYGWDAFFDQMAPVMRHVPYIVTHGNHERDWPGTGTRFEAPASYDSSGECGVATDKRFPMPNLPRQWSAPRHNAPNWLEGTTARYSVDVGPIHFLQFNSELPFGPGSEQYLFIVKDLAAVKRTRTPWVVVGFHRPIYTDSVYGNSVQGDIGNTADLQNALERVFFQFQVDMTWYGHVHHYSRTCPVFQHTCLAPFSDGSASAPVHVLIGHAGAPYSWAVNPVTPKYYDAVAVQHGYMRVTANATRMHCEVINVLEGGLTDSFTLHKPRGWQANQTRQLERIGVFHSAWTPGWAELSGINKGAEELILAPAEKILFSDPDLLDQLKHAALVQDPTAPDTVRALDEIFEPIDHIFRKRVAHAEGTSAAARFFYDHYFRPLFRIYRHHKHGVLKVACDEECAEGLGEQ